MDLIQKLNFYGKTKTPFFFCISYDMSKNEISPLNKLPNDIHYTINNIDKNYKRSNLTQPYKESIPYQDYKIAFDKVQKEIKEGNTYLLNLSFSTKIQSPYSLYEIYQETSAKYKLYYKNKFVSFSPETFVTIENNLIATFPMKGTIDANILNAKDKILASNKEAAEHTMVVDLLRNDMNKISKNVRVEKYRYIDTINAGTKQLLQVSSKIVGDLSPNWHQHIGDILVPLLPAGSISGTPKKKTIEIINNIEHHQRDYFSGIWGIYDGEKLTSSILIRYIENQEGLLVYKSGGGITYESDSLSEYNEMLDKVYFP